jgi:hypothetical protein
MSAKRELPDPASMAASSASTKDTRVSGKFRRRLQPGSQTSETRNENGANRQEGSTSREKAVSVEDTSSIFGGGDKRQKKVIYREFSENPNEVLETVVEDIPEPPTEKDVVIKISVSNLSLDGSVEERVLPLTYRYIIGGNCVI